MGPSFIGPTGRTPYLSRLPLLIIHHQYFGNRRICFAVEPGEARAAGAEHEIDSGIDAPPVVIPPIPDGLPAQGLSFVYELPVNIRDLDIGVARQAFDGDRPVIIFPYGIGLNSDISLVHPAADNRIPLVGDQTGDGADKDLPIVRIDGYFNHIIVE